MISILFAGLYFLLFALVHSRPGAPITLQPKNPNAPLFLTKPKSVLVMGGGIAGLSAAMELAERGYQVTYVINLS
jgi:NADPH-dependent 2,4-dienoyl-CoA reductase/sulfur reductase-like enzyme